MIHSFPFERPIILLWRRHCKSQWIAALYCALEMATRAVKQFFWVCSQDCGKRWDFKEALQEKTFEVLIAKQGSGGLKWRRSKLCYLALKPFCQPHYQQCCNSDSLHKKMNSNFWIIRGKNIKTYIGNAI